MKYYTVRPDETLESVLNKLDEEYGLNNLYPAGGPESLIGNAKILAMRTVNRGDVIKIDGPGHIIFRIYDKLLRRDGKIKA